MKRKPTHYGMLTDKQKAFVDIMAKGYSEEKGRKNQMTKREAYVKAGYADSCATSSAHDLHLRLRKFIDDRRVELVSEDLSPVMALSVINQIMNDESVNPQVRLKAAQDVMSRSGFDSPTEIVTTTKVENLPDKDLDEELEDLIERSGNVRAIKSA